MNIDKILKLLEVDSLTVHFQPIFSLGSKKVIGLEALLRGEKDGELISPLTLFEEAEKKGLKVELDRAARYLAFSTFKKHFPKEEKIYLFFNFDASIIDQSKCVTWYIKRIAEECKLHPSQIVIEIIETKVRNFEYLKNFVKTYKNLGFLIALDDVGVDYSNLNRIVELKPDFLKIDRILIKDLAKDEYKGKLIKALTDLTKQIGSFILAEGIETEKDLFKSLELGVDFHQGFFLGPPIPPEEFIFENYYQKLSILEKKFAEFYLKEIISYKKHLYELYKKIVVNFSRILRGLQKSSFEEMLNKLVNSYEFIQSAYIVDTSNKLCTPIVFNKKFSNFTHYTKLLPILFKKGDHLPIYPHTFYLLSGEYEQFISEPYIHFLTKKEVCTVSQLFHHPSTSNHYILCMDFLVLKKPFIKNIIKKPFKEAFPKVV